MTSHAPAWWYSWQAGWLPDKTRIINSQTAIAIKFWMEQKWRTTQHTNTRRTHWRSAIVRPNSTTNINKRLTLEYLSPTHFRFARVRSFIRTLYVPYFDSIPPMYWPVLNPLPARQGSISWAQIIICTNNNVSDCFIAIYYHLGWITFSGVRSFAARWCWMVHVFDYVPHARVVSQRYVIVKKKKWWQESWKKECARAKNESLWKQQKQSLATRAAGWLCDFSESLSEWVHIIVSPLFSRYD